ncbi:MAG: SRPBCC domain-containing protein [Armatimonadota bacterium]|nr:SRPBCC domain-containing protein [Armatimonadota bacterium]
MFERAVEADIEIFASPAQVWWQLTDFPRYADWNPLLIDVRGELEEGSRLTVTVKPDGLPPVVIRPEIVVCEPERELRWVGRLGVGHLLDAEHAFIIKSRGINRVHFTQRETFSGVLAPGGTAVVGEQTLEGLRAMNAALRQRAEAAHATAEAARARRKERG